MATAISDSSKSGWFPRKKITEKIPQCGRRGREAWISILGAIGNCADRKMTGAFSINRIRFLECSPHLRKNQPMGGRNDSLIKKGSLDTANLNAATTDAHVSDLVNLSDTWWKVLKPHAVTGAAFLWLTCFTLHRRMQINNVSSRKRGFPNT
ncbi:hypothetical protein CEXT_158481 [Caerostris extrusa]|uniref:Uncharacterized protein n=1 Tax=Caerostris extrusa TaxID=172846 RepID=A0AAV4WXU5_CAEEX|nr:hypothetical protein CEXT_158481 [Caerostris extrusa]